MRNKNTFFDGTTYKKTVARFWPLWAAYQAAWIILLPLQGLMELRRQSNAVSSGSMERFANMTVPQMTDAALFLSAVFGVLAAMAVFSHLYNARSANLFGSLPIRREGLFATHYLAGLSFLIVPNAVIFLLTLLVEAAGDCVVMQGLAFWLGVACGECFFFYSMAVFCAMFTGHILALPAFYGIFNVLAYGVMMLVRAMLDNFYYGFAGFSDAVGEAVEWLTPVMALARKVESYWAALPVMSPEGVWESAAERTLTTQGLGAVGIYALAAAVLTVCAFFLYRARRLESAGDVVSVQPMKPVFKYGVALCAGMLLGVFTAAALDGGDFTLMAAILIWGVIGYFAAQMLLDKSFRVFKKWKGAAAVAGVFVVVFLVVGFDLTGFETRVPDAADVASVRVQGLNCVNLEDNGDYTLVEVTDPALIAQLIAAHQAAVDERDRDTMGANITCQLELKYTLNNGSTLSRDYRLHLRQDDMDREGTFAWAVEQLYRNTDFYWDVYGFDRLEEAITEEGGRLDSAELKHYNKGWNQTSFVAGYGNDARALLEAVKEDFRAGRIGVRTLADLGYRYEYYDDGVEAQAYAPPDALIFRVMDPERSGANYRLEIALQSTASSTQDLLEDTLAEIDDPANRQALEECLHNLGR